MIALYSFISRFTRITANFVKKIEYIKEERTFLNNKVIKEEMCGKIGLH